MTTRAKRPDVDGGRPHMFRLRLTTAERRELFERAQGQGVSAARYVLTLVFTGELPRERTELRDEMLAIRRLLIRTAANVNQATVHCHITGDTARLADMADGLEGVIARLDRALRRLR